MKKKKKRSQFVYRVIVFVLIILIHIVVIMKQTFSIINIIKTKIHNQMKNDILTDSSILDIKRKIVTKFHTKLNIDKFNDIKERQIPF